MNFDTVIEPDTYLTGRTALNLPDPHEPSGDWHFTSAVVDQRARMHTAGIHGNLVNTNPLLGAYGVHDCSADLRRLGVDVPPHASVYVANHVRAVVDLAMRSILKNRYPHHLETEKWLETPDQFHELMAVGKTVESQLQEPERSVMQEWLQSLESLQ